MGWLKRAKSAAVMGLLWGAAWFGAGVLLMVGVFLGTGSTGADVPYPLGFGLLGFAAGVGFSGVLRLIGARRGFHELSVPGFAVGGVLSGAVLAAAVSIAAGFSPGTEFWTNFAGLSTTFGIGGGVSAAGSLLLARRATESEELHGGKSFDVVAPPDQPDPSLE